MRAKPRESGDPGREDRGPAEKPTAGLSAPWMAPTSLHGWIHGVSHRGLLRRPARATQRSRGFARMARSYMGQSGLTGFPESP